MLFTLSLLQNVYDSWSLTANVSPISHPFLSLCLHQSYHTTLYLDENVLLATTIAPLRHLHIKFACVFRIWLWHGHHFAHRYFVFFWTRSVDVMFSNSTMQTFVYFCLLLIQSALFGGCYCLISWIKHICMVNVDIPENWAPKHTKFVGFPITSIYSSFLFKMIEKKHEKCNLNWRHFRDDISLGDLSINNLNCFNFELITF